MRTPDETRLQEIAEFFGTTVEELRRDNSDRHPDAYGAAKPESQAGRYPGAYQEYTSQVPVLRDSEPESYRVPSLRRDDGTMSLAGVSELALVSARLIGLIGSTAKGVTEGRFEVTKTVAALRALGDILEERLREAENQPGRPWPASY